MPRALVDIPTEFGVRWSNHAFCYGEFVNDQGADCIVNSFHEFESAMRFGWPQFCMRDVILRWDVIGALMRMGYFSSDRRRICTTVCCLVSRSRWCAGYRTAVVYWKRGWSQCKSMYRDGNLLSAHKRWLDFPLLSWNTFISITDWGGTCESSVVCTLEKSASSHYPNLFSLPPSPLPSSAPDITTLGIKRGWNS